MKVGIALKKRYIIVSMLIICLIVVVFHWWDNLGNTKINSNSEASAEVLVPFWETIAEDLEYVRYNESQASNYPRSYYIKGDSMFNLLNAMDFENWEISDDSQENSSQYLIFLDFYKAPYGNIILIDINDTATLTANSDIVEYQMPQGTYNAILNVLEETKTSIREECLELVSQLLSSPESINCYTQVSMDEFIDPETVIYDEESVIEFISQEEISTITESMNSLSWSSPNLEGLSFGNSSIRLIITKDDIWGYIDIFQNDIVLVYGHSNSLSGDFFQAPEGTYETISELIDKS